MRPEPEMHTENEAVGRYLTDRQLYESGIAGEQAVVAELHAAGEQAAVAELHATGEQAAVAESYAAEEQAAVAELHAVGERAAVTELHADRGCTLCPRACRVDRAGGKRGRCGVDGKIRVARAALHMWEEPCISGEDGSGAVFFSGCPLGCVYCQNREISRGERGMSITVERLVEIFLELQQQKANNINLVTAGHFLPQVKEALLLAKGQGLVIPVVYNSSAYESVEALRQLEGLVDVYLPDLKYMSPQLAADYSRAPDYPEIAKAAIGEMVRQRPQPKFDARGIMISGVIVRHLLLPGHVREAKQILKYLHGTYGKQIYVSMMNQYTPMPAVADDPLLGRRVTKREYERLLEYAEELGIEQGFYQEGGTAQESFIPEFGCQGVLPAR